MPVFGGIYACTAAATFMLRPQDGSEIILISEKMASIFVSCVINVANGAALVIGVSAASMCFTG